MRRVGRWLSGDFSPAMARHQEELSNIPMSDLSALKQKVDRLENRETIVSTSEERYQKQLQQRAKEIADITKPSAQQDNSLRTRIAADSLALLSLTNDEIKKIDGSEKSIAFLNASANLARNTSIRPNIVDKRLSNLERELKQIAQLQDNNKKIEGSDAQPLIEQQNKVIEKTIASGKEWLRKSAEKGNLMQQAHEEIEFYKSLKWELQRVKMPTSLVEAAQDAIQSSYEVLNKERDKFAAHEYNQKGPVNEKAETAVVRRLELMSHLMLPGRNKINFTHEERYQEKLVQNTRQIQKTLLTLGNKPGRYEAAMNTKDLASLSLTKDEIKEIDGGEKSVALLAAFKTLSETVSTKPDVVNGNLNSLEKYLKALVPLKGDVQKIANQEERDGLIEARKIAIEDLILDGKEKLAASAAKGDLMAHANEEIKFYSSLKERLEGFGIATGPLAFEKGMREVALANASKQRDAFTKSIQEKREFIQPTSRVSRASSETGRMCNEMRKTLTENSKSAAIAPSNVKQVKQRSNSII
ncbi:hypothetical protein [Candidatus Sarmatiella mevalonica]|uniref:hypothetical protein n=1 Tax=Candidatus Sarmatiella mevalonica TaxID=2770581 RepID=UPI0019250526|nr:hypothetical protein [Candidatus Sarmatiella mevalonica]